MTDDAIRKASAKERLEAAAEMAGCSVAEMRRFLEILHENGGAMTADAFERAWLADPEAQRLLGERGSRDR